jgi:ParB-like chromosome segregation protein Spo0J
VTNTIYAEVDIPASRIRRNPDNPRYEAGDVTDLVASIKEYGLLQSILVRETSRGL